MILRRTALALATVAVILTAGCSAGQEKTAAEICAEDPERCARIDEAVANSIADCQAGVADCAYVPTTTTTTKSYSSSSVSGSSDPGDQACGFLQDSGPTGDPATDRMRRATLDNYCSGSQMSSDPDPCGYLRAAGPTGDPETDRLARAAVNNYC